MRSFDYLQTIETLTTRNVSILLESLATHKGKLEVLQDLQSPLLASLDKNTQMQSIIASNAIENIVTTKGRAVALLEKNAAPKTRDEREIAGYRFVFDEIQNNYSDIALTPNTILQLHRDLYRYTNAGHAGHWKDTDNVIGELTSEGTYVIRFTPATALETPEAMERICGEYARATSSNTVSPLLATLLFTFDFLAIHPFIDGNGRMSRLLSSMLLLQQGCYIGNYISIEDQINSTRDTYYQVLAKSSEGWQEASNDPSSFVLYMLHLLEKSYFKLEIMLEAARAKGSSEERIREYFSRLQGAASKEEILLDNPGVSKRTLERILKKLQDEHAIEKEGAARATLYRNHIAL